MGSQLVVWPQSKIEVDLRSDGSYGRELGGIRLELVHVIDRKLYSLCLVPRPSITANTVEVAVIESLGTRPP